MVREKEIFSAVRALQLLEKKFKQEEYLMPDRIYELLKYA